MYASRSTTTNFSVIPLAPSRRRDRRHARTGRAANQWARLQRAVMETLELRQLLSTVTVTDTSSSITDPNSLPYAIANAQPNETINFDLPGAAPWVISLNSSLVISTNNVTIDGPGAGSLTIQGDGSDPVFELARTSGYTAYTTYSATISGVKITGGANSTYSGGGILNYGVLTLNNSTVTGNTAVYGGGIYNGDALFLNGDTITDNTATSNGGGIDNGGQLTVSNTYFYGNMAVNGGAIQNNAFLTIDNSTFGSVNTLTGDTASGDGGEIYNNGQANISTTTIAHGAAGGRGGGIFDYSVLNVLDSTISGDTSAGAGGGIFDYGATTLINSTLAGDESTGGAGGAVDVDDTANLTATNATISGNSATAGGGINVVVGGDALLNNTIVAGNTFVHSSSASDVAGALDSSSGYNLIGTGGAGGLTNHHNGNTLSVALASANLGPLQNNGGPTDTIALGTNSVAINAGSNALAYDANGDPLVTDQRGYYRVVGSAVDIGAYESSSTSGPTSLVVNTTADTVAYAPGLLTLRQAIGFANFANGNSTITFSPSVFNGSAAPIDVVNGPLTFENPAGQVSVQGPGEADLTVSGAVGGIATNQIFVVDLGATVALSGLTITDGSSSAGGGIANDGTLSVSSALFTNNGNSGSDGGAVENENDLTVTNSTFTDNTGYDGAAIDNSGGFLTVINSAFNSNIAGDVGGGIDNDGNLIIVSTNFTKNQATSGGGIENSGGTVEITGGIFTSNAATGGTGGAIDNQSILTVTGATFLANSAVQGGAVNSNGPVSCEIDNSTFTSDSASGAGGGIFNNGLLILDGDSLTDESAGAGGGGVVNLSVLHVNDSTFAGDHTSAAGGVGGGGIYNYAQLTVTDSSFTGDFTTGAVGGGAIDTIGNPVSISGSTFSGDHTSGSVGGGAILNGGGLSLVNDTFASNSASMASGGAIDDTSTTTISNSTIVGNTSGFSGGAVQASPGGGTTIYNSIVSGNIDGDAYSAASDIAGTINSASAANITGVTNSALLLAPLGNYTNLSDPAAPQTMAPLPGSPAIDAGNSALDPDVTTDQRGQPRLYGGNIDVGAVESQGYAFTALSGSGQTATIFTSFTSPLVTQIVPNFSLDPVDGGLVNFKANTGSFGQSASLSTQTAVIVNSMAMVNATAQVNATANYAAGTYTVDATVNGQIAVFTLTNSVPTFVMSSPTITTTPGPTVVVGSGAPLTDTATLAGGNAETGTIVFTLYSPTNTVVDTETVTVSGNGSYSTPSGYVPTSAGTYQWVADYSGDANNNPVSSTEGSEPEVVSAASPAISTTPGGTIVVGSATNLTDSATLSGGYNETGTIVFTLYGPNDAVVDTETVTVTGNGTYSTPSGYAATSAGTYEWAATYGGDNNNNTVTSAEGNEPEVVSAASPAITTTPGPTVVVGSGAKLTDSASLAGGYNETGTIVFTLYSPTNAVVDTETVTVSGNGSYSTPSGYVPTSTGTYEWAAAYSGDSNNGGASSTVGSEPEVVSAASPAISTTPGGTIVVGSGAKLTDSASLTGGYNETGTIVFTLYSPTNAVVDTETVTVTGNGSYSTPSGYVPTSTGTYEWAAAYSGDSNNNGVTSPEGNEPEVVSAASPTISTTPGGTIVVGSGAKLSDSASLAGGYNETGTIVFTLFSPTNAVVDTETVTVTGNGSYSTPSGYIPTSTGTYEWAATYSGDSNNNTVTSAEGNEPEVVTAASPAISTTPGPTVVVGSGAKLTDSASLSGGYNETGTIVFTLFSPTNAVVDTETVSVTGNGSYSTPSGYVPTSTGTYEWAATYSGDSNNNTISSAEGNEPEIVSAASPAISTTPGPTVVVGSGAKLTDSASLSGGYNETGTIVFTLYSPTNAVVDTETVTVTGNGSYSTPSGYVPTSTGTYEWAATYSGDSNNNTVTSAEGNEPEVVSAASPAISTTPGPTVVVGSGAKLTDSASLSGGYNETGTIVFTLYSPTNAVVDTETVSVSGNGSYTTPSGYVPTSAGTYEWAAAYSGDSNNNTVSSAEGNEPEIVTAASPAISTTPGGTIVVGSGAKLTDSASLSGGYNETGTIVFTLYSPTNAVVDTETVTVTGNGSYSTPSGYVPTSTGTYEWAAAYSGDSNNSGASSTAGSEPEVVIAASPTIVTTPSQTSITLSTSSPTLDDSAVLSGGFNETGSITFTLIGPSNTTLDTETVTVSGNGTYTTPAGYTLPASGGVTGVYQWDASYTGDTNNNAVSENNATSEQTTVSSASPTITTTPGGTIVIGSGSKLTDSASLSGGYNETGTIVFTLYSPTNAVVDTETVSVSGNGSYSTPSGYVPTSTGTYEWAAAYSGNSNNSAVSSPEGNEPEFVSAASPTITTTPGGNVTTGLTDTATLSGGYSETGTIVFTLYSPSNTLVDTETVTVSGNGNYTTPSGYVPTIAGTYEWDATYSGDANNNSATDNGDTNEQTTVSPATPTITTTPGGAVVLGSGGVLTDSATLSGGLNETGTIVFSLYSPTDVVVDTITVSVSGNGTYGTPSGYVPTSAGTYEWVAAYGGDSNNSSASSPMGSEPEVVSAAGPTITTTPGGTIVIGSGSKLTDSATLSGGFNETGSITFTLYSPTSAVVDTITVSVSGNGTYNTPSGYTPTSTGTYEWAAAYSGDSNNNSAASTVGSEPETVTAASPAITTTPGATVVIGSGNKLTDSATLSGGYNETGSVTFTLYSPTNTVVDTVTVAVSGNGTYNTPSGYTPTSTGTYEWAAAYSGDASNNIATSAVGSEPEIVSAAGPTITTTPGGTVVIGSGNKLTDSATLSGGYNETGSITFTLFSPTNTVVDTVTVAVNGNGTYSVPTGYTPTSTGTYEWAAAYSGDASNNSVSSSVGSEPETVSAASPTISTTPGATVVIGSGNKLTDSATLSGGYNETGSITFTLYSPTNTVVDTVTVAVNGNGTYSVPTGYTPTSTGTYEWAAAYSGDASNNSVSSTVGSEPEIVSAASPAISTTPGATVVIGSGNKLTDSATLSGGYNETGSITFTLYSPTNVVVDTVTVAVSGNGTFSVPTGYTPTSTGTYEWAAAYSGDSNNHAVSSTVGSEPETVSLASPTITTTPGATVVIGSGNKLTDSATLSGGYNETGSITFTLYSPANVVVDTVTVAVSGNGTYSVPTGYTPTSTGTYEWAAAYSGDSNNNSVSSTIGSEPEVVSAASPTITTTPGGTVVIGSGNKLTDSATLSGGFNDTGSITFTLYSPSNAVVDTVTVAVSGNGTYSIPTGYTPTAAGTYEWAAAYSGDSNNNAVSSPKTAELEVVSAASPTITTTPGGTVVIGSGNKLTDSATLSGGFNDTGSITFTLYSPSNAVVDTVTVAVSGNGTYSIPTGYTPTAAGTYEWAAAYSGDSNNNAVSSPKTAELEVVSAASPTITTTPGGAVVIGSASTLTDSATLSGGYSETGSIVFTLYSPTNVVVDTVTVAVSGNGTYATPTGYTPTSTGTYEWAAAFSGDANNNAVSSPKTAELESVSAASPTISTTPGASVVIGSANKLTDSATLSGGYNETGSIVFSLYSPTNVVVDTVTVAVSGNGTYSVPTGYTPTSIGTYEWAAAYSGDSNNNAVSSPKTAELETVTAASPTITTTPGGTVAIGSGSKMTDTATLSGGFSETGTVTFTLYSPTNTVVDTETATVSGNGSVSTPNGYTPTSAGTYQWVASYSGDANNNSVTSPKGSEPEIAIPPQQIDLTVVKTESTSQTCLGNNVTYTVTISNATGYGTATGVLLTDVLPSGLTFVSATPSVGTYSSSTGVWTLGTLASGSTATLQVVAKTTCYGVFINTASVTSANQTDVDTSPTSSVSLVVGAALTGTVYVDNNGDCQFDGNDTGLANVTVELVDSYGKVVLTTTSNSTGGYSFLGVAPGNYQVEFVAPSGYLFDCIDGTAVNNSNCGYNNYNNCGNTGNNNNNNCWGGNYNFNWCGQSFGGCDGGNNNCGYTCTSCGGGSFSYTYCDTGNSDCNWSWNNCGNNGYNSCNTGGNVGSACVTLVCGTTTTGFNAGAYQPGTIGDFVWLDNNGNGLIDSSEPGLRNITVELLNSTAKSVLETTQTNSQGYYSFTNLTPGQYVVEFISPCGYVFTTEGVGSNAAINSSANTKTGQTSVISLASGQTDNSVNAGLYQPACVSGTVYVDYNNDGNDDCGDPGLTGITVQLINSSGQVVQSATTGCSGTYSFSNVAPGTYTIYVPQTQSALNGFLAGKDTIGTVNGSSDGTVTSAGIISNVVLASGANGVNYNFGVTAQGQTLTAGDCGSIAFWNSQSGQNLLECLNGNSNSTGLGNWLSSTFANIYGKNCGAFNMTAKTNSQVWQIFQTLVNQCGTSGQCAAQVLVCAFNCYVTNSTLCGTVACNYGFTTCAGGAGNCMFNVWTYGQAAGTANYTVMSVMQIVLYCNTRAVNGSLYNGNTNLQDQADDLFTAINQAGDIGAD